MCVKLCVMYMHIYRMIRSSGTVFMDAKEINWS